MIITIDQLLFDAALDRLFGTFHIYYPSSPAATYVSLLLAIAIIVWERYLFHTKRAFRERIQDRSEVEGYLVSAKHIEPRLADPERPTNYHTKEQWCQCEVKRLEGLGPDAWTEITIVPLLQQLADFLKSEDLKAEADSVLADLNDYATSARNPYDIRAYEEWKNYIEDSKDQIDDDATDEETKDRQTEPLRAQLKVLYDHLASYQRSWSEGTALLAALRTVCVYELPLLFVLALIPFLHAEGSDEFGILHWAVLGVVGALAAVLYQLRNSDLVEVGNTEGTGELRQAIGASALGLVAGSLAWSLVAAGAFGSGGEGGLVPSLSAPKPELEYVGKSVLWGLGAGFSLQRVFGRLRAATFGD